MPRKSAVSTATPNLNGEASVAPSEPATKQTTSKDTVEKPEKPEKQAKRKSEGDVIALDDLLLPRTITQRICKGVLPANTQLHRDAVLALTKSATVFISMLAAEANDMTERKTIQSADVIKALREIEMGEVMQLGRMGSDGKRGGRVEREIEKWEEDVKGKRKGYREKVRARESGVGGEGDTTMGSMGEEVGEDERIKRARLVDETGEEGSAEPIVNGTKGLQLGGERGEEDVAGEEIDEGDESEDDEEEGQDDEDGEEDEPEETQDVEDTMEMDDPDRDRRKNDTLAPDGRVEVGGSDDESD